MPPEGDDEDIGDLFEAVSTFKPAQNDEEPSKSIDQLSSEQEISNSKNTPTSQEPDALSRPVLTLPDTPPQLQPQIWRRAPNQPRPLDDILDIFSEEKIHLLEISDPYAIADSIARASQVEFVKALFGRAKSISQVIIEYRPPRDDFSESESFQRRDVGARWNAALGASAQNTRLILKARRKTPLRDFHDRFVFLHCARAGGTLFRHELILGKGLIALMQPNHECSITYVPPST